MKKVIILALALALGLASCKTESAQINNSVANAMLSANIDPRVNQFLDELKTNEIKVCRNDNSLPSEIKKLIFDYEKAWQKDSMKSSFFCTGFDKIYTFNKEKCNLSCIISADEPRLLLKYLIKTNNHIATSYLAGGFTTNHYITTYKIDNNKVISHWTVIINSKNPIDLAGQLLSPSIHVMQ
jgi:hypothetical protein